MHAALRAASQAHEALGVLGELLDRHAWLTRVTVAALARVRVRASNQPAEVAPAAPVSGQQSQMTNPALIAVEARHLNCDLGSVDRPYGCVHGGHGELHCTGQ
jgi:hypothetical protein